jgi:RNA polymerase sigma factor (sigma-70 family)
MLWSNTMDFATFIQAMRNPLTARFRRFTKNAHDAEDLFQAATVKCWERKQWRDKGYEELLAIMTTVGRNIYFDERKKDLNRKKRDFGAGNLILERACQLPPSDHELAEERTLIAQGLQHLPDSLAEVLRRTFFRDQKSETIAEEMRLTVPAVKSRRFRALKNLRTILTPVSSY